jgi:hypothetical protein
MMVIFIIYIKLLIMRKYEVEGLGVETLKTTPQEITLNLFKQMLEVQDEHWGDFEYYLKVFKILGLSDEYLDVMDSNALFTTIKDFQDDFEVSDIKMKNTIEIDGYYYKSYDDKFIIKAKDFANIEKRMKLGEHNWIIYAMALLFKRTDLSINEHMDKTHIEHKMKLFKDEVTMDIALPYIIMISNEYMDNIMLLTKDK